MKLSELTAENIRNTKIHVKNEHESKAFQERVFELGGKWCDNDKSVSKEYMPFLLIDGALNMHRKITSERMEYTEPPNVELQIDFTNKPDWSDAPEWAQWLAQDGGGSWWWYAIKPSESAGGWMENDHACAKHWPGFYIPNPTWYDTLEQRPEYVVDMDYAVNYIFDSDILEQRPDHISHIEKMVNQPAQPHEMVNQIGGSHYQQFKIQPIDFIAANNLSFMTGNVIKHVARYDKKGGLEDLKKARYYLDKLIGLLDNDN